MDKQKRWLYEEADKPLSPVIGHCKAKDPFTDRAYYAKRMTYVSRLKQWFLQILVMQGGSLDWRSVTEEELICKHNAMVPNGEPGFAWKCANCGYVYGK